MATSSHFALLIFMHFLLITSCLAMKQSNIATDQSALLALKACITSDPQQILYKNWSSTAVPSSVCDWIGVRCGLLHRRVTTLNISGMALRGTIPPHLGNLSFLVSLDMSKNYFHGNLPQEISRLRRLRSIWLYYNNFTGPIPTWFGPKLQFLSLGQNNFSGVIPSSISNLSRLEGLDFAINFLTGMIPKEIGNLQRLRGLYLHENYLVGSVPPAIFNISTLEIIVLGHNNITGSLPNDICHHSPNLKGIYVSFNQLNGQILSSLTGCTKLLELSLSYNNFNGFIPTQLCNLEMLERLYLGGTNVQGIIPREIGRLRSLQVFTIENSGISGFLPEEIGNLSMLTFFDLTGNFITGIIPASIGNCSNLTRLRLGRNQLTGSIPKSIGNLQLLKHLVVSSNNLANDPTSLELDFLVPLTNCKSLLTLDIEENPLNGILPSSIGNFSASFTYLYAGATNIRGPIPSEIGNLSSLILISLENNQLIGTIPQEIQELKRLQFLSLWQNKLEGTLDRFCNMQSLAEMDFSQNQLSGSIPNCFGDMTSLRKLDLSRNLLTSSIPRSFGKLKDLLYLNLSSNSFNESLPLEMEKLKATISMDLSMNQISGAIPSTLGGLQNLQNLSLANNQLEGSIPETFGNMLSLTTLDLSHNNLSGLIPKSLEAIRFLESFDVSFNHLMGEIPSEGPFKNFTGESFISNDGLCGDQKFHVRQCQTNTRKHRLTVIRRVLLLTLIPLVITILVVPTLAYLFWRNARKNNIPKADNVSLVPTKERISYYELLQATNRYNESNFLGSGSFGSVYKGILNDGSHVAVKVFNLQHETSLKSFDVECQVLRNLRHRNLLKVISSCCNPDFKALVLEYMPNGSLGIWLHSDNRCLNMLQRLNIMIDVANALYYLHEEYSTPVLHCDLKPNNILLDEDLIAHVSDFGIAKFLGEDESTAFTNTMATIGYMAPEYGREGLVSKACDVFSYGILLMEVFTGRRPTDETFGENRSLKSWINYSMPDSISEIIDADLLRETEEHYTSNKMMECLSCIMKLALNCVSESPKKRHTMSDIVDSLKKIKVRYVAKS